MIRRIVIIVVAFFLWLEASVSALAATLSESETATVGLQYSFFGTTQTFNISGIPQFPPSAGALQSVTIYQSHQVLVNAQSEVEAGQFIYPNNVADWNWAAESALQFTAPGASYTSPTADLSAYGEYDSPISPESAVVNATYALTPTGMTVPGGSNSYYVGTGTVPMSLELGVTTQIPPLPATYAGFTWQLISQTLAAGISMQDTASLEVSYNYIPTPTYTLSASVMAPTIIVGGSSAITAVLANTSTASDADTIVYTGLTAIGGSILGPPASGAVAPGFSGSNASLSFTSSTAGTYAISPSTTTVAGLNGTTPVLTSTNTGTITVLGHSNPVLSIA